ncbi:MAG TPA: hypothetical protein VEZ90_03220 [Blastocatellia bacterium]|nr:hypothetical protein [Blastocatellia bacterium]
MFVSLILLLTVGPVRQQMVAVKHDEAVPATRRQPSLTTDAERPRYSAGDTALTVAPKSSEWVILCANPNVLKELAEADGTKKAQDQIDLGEDNGIMLMLPANITVVVVETRKVALPGSTVAMVKVRVTDQDNRGRIGWLLEDSLRPLKYIA